ncbi:MAG: extracellular solute-binding protein [Candidatus Omnitrophica bacterium]|nr:extracellular solute-binding protein [Candidatus Omnitrophota bacterium]
MELTRKLISLVLVGTFAFFCSSCGEQVREDKLVMWLVGSEAQAKAITKLSEKFTEATGTKVSCQAISWGDAHSKYLTSIAGDVSPDIGTMGLTWGMEFGTLGAMVDLKKEFSSDITEMEKKIFPGVLRSTQVGDSVYGIPFDLSEHIMYYRNDIIPNPPRTWDELLALLKTLKGQGKGMVIDWGSLGWIGYSPFFWQAGGSYYNKDRTKVTVDSPEGAEALRFFAELYKAGVPKTNVPVEQGMRTGDFPLAISGNWKIISLTLGAPEIKGKWSISTLPEGPSGKGTAFIGGRVLGIFSRSEKKTEAWEFIKFLFNPENQQLIYKDSLETEDSYLPPNMDSWKNLKMDPSLKNVLEKQAKDAKGPPPVLAWDASTRFLDHAIQMVILKGADPGSELKIAAQKMQKELDSRK